MKKTALVISLIFGLSLFISGISFQVSAETKTLANSKGPVALDHTAHKKVTGCKTCHTVKMGKVAKGAGHSVCKKCHKDGGKGPTGCNDCHK